jgi:hypothetical protein
VTHRRRVLLDRTSRHLDIVDEFDGGGHDLRLAFHLGPDVEAELDGSAAVLRWPGAAGPQTARLDLPAQLRWSLHSGESDPILGWYAHGLGRRVAAYTLLGRGRCAPDTPFATRLAFQDAAIAPAEAISASDVSWTPSGAQRGKAPATHAEAG